LGLQANGPISAFHGKPRGATTVDPARTREAPPSHPVLPQAHPLLGATLNRYPETWVRGQEGLQVYGPTISVTDEDGRLLGDVSVEWGRKAEANWAFRRWRLPRPRHVPGKALVLASTGGNTYFHWMTDVLPRIRLARQAGLDPLAFDRILVNGLDQPFQKETLARFGIFPDRCLVFPGWESAYELREATLPSLPGIPGVVPPETAEFLKREFAVSGVPASRRIFIGRGGAGHRALVQEREISRELAKRGFENVECGNLSVREQAEVFASAEMVVGAHGAALTNLVFCRPGTRVIELFSPRYVNPCYRDLCVAAGLRHGAVIGNGRDWFLSTRHDEPSAPITASWPLLGDLLAADFA